MTVPITQWRIERDEAVGATGMVASKHPLAAEIGLAVLRRGGNAIDAAVTMAFALGVVEPGGSGLGGGGYMVVHLADSRRTIVVDYAMDAPMAARPDTYPLEAGASASQFGWPRVEADANVFGYRAVAVPGAARGLASALARFGTVSLATALEPAIDFAENGFPTDWRFTLWIADQMEVLQRYPATAAIFLPNGRPPRPSAAYRAGDQFRQPDLGRTLRQIAANGPDAFYLGETARRIGQTMREYEGLITEVDLARYQPTIYEAPLSIDYRDYTIVGPPGASGAVTALQALKLLEGYDLGVNADDLGLNLHRQAEAFRLTFADRYAYVADHQQVDVPWRGLLASEYAAARRALIQPDRALPTVQPGDPWASEPTIRAAPPTVGHGASAGETSTTHLCVVDRDRNVVSLTQTLVNLFGSAAVAPGTGVLLNNAMQWFDPVPGRPNSIGPGKRGLNNMTPLLALRDGRPCLAIGASGGRRIMNALTQTIVKILDQGVGPQAAIAAPRIDCSGAEVVLDQRLPSAASAGLRKRGHNLQFVEEDVYAAHFSTPVAIVIDPANGALRGGVDPLRPGGAGGY